MIVGNLEVKHFFSVTIFAKNPGLRLAGRGVPPTVPPCRDILDTDVDFRHGEAWRVALFCNIWNIFSSPIFFGMHGMVSGINAWAGETYLWPHPSINPDFFVKEGGEGEALQVHGWMVTLWMDLCQLFQIKIWTENGREVGEGQAGPLSQWICVRMSGDHDRDIDTCLEILTVLRYMKTIPRKYKRGTKCCHNSKHGWTKRECWATMKGWRGNIKRMATKFNEQRSLSIQWIHGDGGSYVKVYASNPQLGTWVYLVIY